MKAYMQFTLTIISIVLLLPILPLNSEINNPEFYVDLLISDVASERITAYNSLVEIGEDAIPVMLGKDWNENGLYFEICPRIIHDIGDPALQPLSEILQEAINSGEYCGTTIQIKGLYSLFCFTEMGPDAVETLPIILEALNSNFAPSFACEAIEAINLATPAVIKGLLDKLNDDILTASAAILALGTITEPNNEEVISALIQLFNEGTNEFLTIELAYALYKLDYNKEDMLQIIIDQFEDKSNISNRIFAIYALARIGDENSLDLLKNSLYSTEEHIKFVIMHGIRRYYQADETIDILTGVLSDEDRNVVMLAAMYLGWYGPEAINSLAELEYIYENWESQNMQESDLTYLEEAILLISG